MLKKIKKERVEKAMKSDVQRVAIDFTVTDCMMNKVSRRVNVAFKKFSSCSSFEVRVNLSLVHFSLTILSLTIFYLIKLLLGPVHMNPVNRAGSVSQISPHYTFLCKNFDVFI